MTAFLEGSATSNDGNLFARAWTSFSATDRQPLHPVLHHLIFVRGAVHLGFVSLREIEESPREREEDEAGGDDDASAGGDQVLLLTRESLLSL